MQQARAFRIQLSFIASPLWLCAQTVQGWRAIEEANRYPMQGPCNPSAFTLGWPGPYIHAVYDCMYGDFSAKNTIYKGPSRS